MKNKFIYVAILVFSVMMAMTAFAGDTWKQTEDGKWYCYDKDGNTIYGEAKKSGSSFYYLDEATGEMVINKLVEIDGAKYWFGADGAKVADQWVKVPVENDDDGWEWMYFKPISGKAEVTADKFVTINGKKYRFNGEGYMLYGYLTDNFDKADNVVVATYYLGDKNDGAQFTGWQKFENGAIDAPGYDDKALVYFYFKNGKKIAAEKDVVEYKIDGVKYYFNEDGSMFSGYQVYATGSTVATGTYYLGKNDDGTMKKKQWVKTTEVEGGDTAYWYYLGSDGRVTTTEGLGKIKKINGKFYLLAATGRMKTGVAVINIPSYQGYNNIAEEAHTVVKIGFDTVDELKKYELAEGDKIYYFSTDADNDGSLKTSNQTIVLDDEEVTLYLDKHGVALEGVVKGYVYNNGLLQKGVGVVKCNKEDTYYLVNASGKILKNTVVKDSDGETWAVNDTLGIAKIADQDYLGKAATAWKNGVLEFNVGKDTYELDADWKGTYFYVKYSKKAPN